MSGVEAIGLALGFGTLGFGLIPSILDYRSLPDHCSELQDFITRQSTSLAIMEADFRALMARELLSPGSLPMTEGEVESLQNLLQRYRKCLEDFQRMLNTMVKPKSTAFEWRRLQMILKGKTGTGMGTLQSRQSFLQMYMVELEATGYRKKLEANRIMHPPYGSRLSKVRLGRTASAAYKVPPSHPCAFRPVRGTPPPLAPYTPNIDVVRPASPAETLVAFGDFQSDDFRFDIPTRDDAASFVTLAEDLVKG